MKILAVDDKDDARYLLRALLTGQGHAVEEAANGREALAQLRADRFDLIISDILMPVMDGFQLCRAVRNDDQLKSVPFVFYTATYTQDSDAKLAMQLGADDFIIKPAEPQALLSRIQAVIAKASAKGWKPRRPEVTDEADILRLYSERLVAKLEQRTAGLDAELEERHKIEEALRESEERFRQLFSHMSSCVAVYRARSGGEDFVVVDFNEAAERVEALSKEDAVGKSVQELFPGIEEFGLLEVFRRVWKTGVPERHPVTEYRDRRIQGWRENYVYRLPSGEIVSIYDDITAQKQAEEKIRWLSSLPDENPNPVMRIAGDGKLLYVNKAGEALVRTWGSEVGAIVPSHLRELVQRTPERERTDSEIGVDGRTLLLTISPVAGGGYVNVYSADITRMKQAEEALRRREKDYRLVVESASEAIFIAQDGYVKFPNSATMTFLGRTAEDLASHPFVEFIHPDDREMVAERHKRRLAGEDVEAVYEFRFVTADGDVRRGRLNATRIEWQGRPATLNLVSDVTERRRVEEALRASEAQLSNALRIAHAGHWEYDVPTDTFTFNDNFYRIFRTTAAEVGGYTMSSAEYARRFCHPDDVHMVREETQAAIETDDPYYGHQLEHRIRYADGEVGHLAVRFFVVKDAQGRTVKTYGVNQDITEHKRVEEALIQKDQEVRDIVESSKDWIWSLDVGGRHTFSNPAVEDILGYTPAEFLGRSAFDLLHPEDRSSVEAQLPQWIADRVGWRGVVLRWRHKAGGYRHLESSAVPVLDAAGELVGFRGVDRDITERAEAEQRIRSALEGTIQVVAETIEKRDPYTAGHQKRVTRLAVAIAQKLRLSDEQVEGIRVAATLHDIGKISIPAEILSKPGKLSREEYGLIQEHPSIAHALLKGIAFPWPVADIILQHHERLDGMGYPRGLTAEDGILLEARILAVADVVEAMATHRPYRPSLGIEAALEEIEAKSGAEFDPDVVDACVELFASGEFTLD